MGKIQELINEVLDTAANEDIGDITQHTDVLLEFANDFNSQQKTIDKQARQLAIAIEALGFYKNNPDNRAWGIYESDYGNTAREALGKIKELEK